MKHVRATLAAVILSMALVMNAASAADAWKASGPVTIRVSNNAGGIMDIITRIAAKGLQESCGQTVIVTNVTGASGALAANEVLALEPLPEELFVTGMAVFTMTPLMNPEINTSIDNFTIVSNLIADDFLVFVNPASGIKSIDELVKYAKENRVLFGSGVPGSTTHMLAVELLDRAGIPAENYSAVTSNGSPTDLLAVANGNVQFCVATMGAGRQFTEAGTAVPVGVFSKENYTRFGLNVPTFQSLGYDIVAQSCNLLLAKKGIDQAVADQIHADLQAYYRTAEFKDLADKAGYIPSSMNGAQTLEAIKEYEVLCKEIFKKFYAEQ